MASRKFGWHSGTLTCQDAKIRGDCYIQDDLVFSDVSAGTLGVTGGIDMTGTTSAIGINMTGGTFSTSAIQIGSSTSQMTITSGQIPLDINTTTADTSGTQTSMNVKQIGTVDTRANQTEVFVAEFETEKESGDWANAIVGRIDYGTTGDAAGGMAAAICAELNYPGKACAGVGGAYYVLDLEMNCPENFTCGTNASYPNAFINIGFWGNATAMGTWEDNGHFIRTDGFTAGASNVLSANSHTLRCNIEGNTRYLFTGQKENGVGLGVTGSRMTLTASSPLLDIWATSSATSGNLRTAQINTYYTGTTGTENIEAFTSIVTAAVSMGQWANALFGKIDMTTSGAVSGTAGAVCAEISMPDNNPGGGRYSCFQAEIDQTCTGVGIGSCFLNGNAWGTNVASWRTSGDIFIFTGLGSATAGKVFDECTAAAASHALRIDIDGTSYYIMLQSNVDA